MDNFKKKELMFLIFIFCFAFALRVSYCFFFKENILHIQTHIFGDTQDYIQIANNFLSGKGLISSPDRIAYRPPLYPLFLSGVYYLFGNGYWPIRIIQSILDALTCVMVYFLGRMVLNKQTGEIASFICVIYPFFIFFTGFELTETLFIFLLLTTIYLFQRTKKNPNCRNMIITGISLGMSILCHPSLTMFVFVLLITLAISALWRGWENRFKIIGIVLTVTILTILPWSVRNFYHFKKFVPLTTMSGRTFWEGNNPYSSGGPCQYWPEEIQNLSEVESDKYLTKTTIKVIKEDPTRFLKLLVIKFTHFWNVKPNYEGFSSPLYNLISIFSYIPIMVTSIWGMFLTKKIWRSFLIFYLLFISFTFTSMIFVGSIRYRTPIMPFMIIFSAYTLKWIYNKTFSLAKK